MAASSVSDPAGSMRYFSGDSECPQEYKRWKNWTRNKLMTMDRLPKKASGAFVFTLLTGKALECVEHLEPSSYQVEHGEDVLFDLLDVRFPEKDSADELGEMMTQIFSLQNLPGESLKGWIGRAAELFDRLKRKTNVDFPKEARGWLILNRCGLSNEQKAVVLARAGGKLDKESIGLALRSCRRASPAHLVEDTPGEQFEVNEEVSFEDAEIFLAEHGVMQQDDAADEFLEPDVAEVLAVSWREKRSEINRLQRQRKFQQAQEVKRQFRVEIEEIKKKSPCTGAIKWAIGPESAQTKERRTPQKDPRVVPKAVLSRRHRQQPWLSRRPRRSSSWRWCLHPIPCWIDSACVQRRRLRSLRNSRQPLRHC